MEVVRPEARRARGVALRLALLAGLVLAAGLGHTYLSLLSHGTLWLAHPVRAFEFERKPREGLPLGKHHTLLHPPPYARLPEQWNQLGRSVRMQVEFRLAPDGRVVGKPRVLLSSGDPQLDAATVEAIGRWRFGPLPAVWPEREPERVRVWITNRYRVDLGWEGVGWRWLLFSGLLVLCALLLPGGGGQAAPLLATAGLLAGLGWLLIWRLAPDLEEFDLPFKQAAFLAASLLLTTLTARLVAHWRGLGNFLQRTGAFWVGVGLLLLVATALIGEEQGTGHRLWLPTPLGPIQTIELVKIILVLYAAAFFGLRAREGPITIWVDYKGWVDRYRGLLGAFFLVLATLVLMRDFGPFLLLLLLLITGLYAQGERRAALSLSALLLLGLATSYWLAWPSRWRARVDIWRHPWQAIFEAGDEGRPEVQRGREHLARVIWAVSSGGWRGWGLGQGLPQDIAAVESDFNFAAIAEELGFWGGSLILLLLLLLVWLGWEVAFQRTEPFERFLAAGIAALFGWQAFLTVGSNLALVPPMGLTLPFISYGGSSLVMNFLALGLLLGVAGRGASRASRARVSPAPLRHLQWGFALLFLGLLVKLAWLQWPGHRERYALAPFRRPDGTLLQNPRVGPQGNFISPYTAPGRFVDRKGTVLAETTPQGKRYPQGWHFVHLIGFEASEGTQVGLERALRTVLLGQWRPSLPAWLRQQLRLIPQGYNVVLTLDQEFQAAAYEELRRSGKVGCIVAIQPATGEVLVAANRPALDPYASTAQEWLAAYDSKPNAPPFCYRKVYPPGSVLKTLVAAAALETGSVAPEETFLCQGVYHPPGPGKPIFDFGRAVHGPLTLHQALIPSCNCVFAQVGVRLGWQKLFDFADRAGFNRFIPLIPAELRGEETLVCSQSVLWEGGRWAEEVPKEWKQPNVLARTALGEFNVRVTPLYLALWAAAIANGGKMMEPSVVKAITDAQGRILWRLQPRVWLKVMSPQTASLLTAMMVDAVEKGTGRSARIPGVAVAGKTGTPEAREGRNYALFIAFAPADAPQVALAVVLEDTPETGGRVAAPMAKRLLQRMLGGGLE